MTYCGDMMVVLVEGVPWLVALPPDGGLELMLLVMVIFCAIVSICRGPRSAEVNL